jgi:hypothetical protein
MRVADIQVGRTYVNRGAGRTQRKVLAIGDEHRPKTFFSNRKPPNERGVLFEQAGRQSTLYISSFATWAAREA